MSGKGSQVQETPQQIAMANFAMNQLADYKQRWLPVQKQLANQIEAAGAPGSAQRQEATGKAATDTSIQFAQAQGALEKTLTNNGANVNSSRAKLAVSGMGEDAAHTRGMGTMISDQQVTDAYTQGLGALTAIGRGEKSNVENGLVNQANTSAQTAAASAQASQMERGGIASGIGQIAGYGLQQSFRNNTPGAVPPPNYGGWSGAPGMGG